MKINNSKLKVKPMSDEWVLSGLFRDTHPGVCEHIFILAKWNETLLSLLRTHSVVSHTFTLF